MIFLSGTGTHGTTFGGSPLACTIGYHVLDRLSQREFVSHLEKTSGFLVRRLERLSEWFPELVGPIRGRGLIIGVVLLREGHPQKLLELARERGLLLLTAGTDCVRLVPSLNVNEEEVSHAVDVIESCLSLLSRS
jgi:acetylornithine aminotransferase